MKKTILISALLLIACAGTSKQGDLTVDYISGAFEPTIALATMKNYKTGEVTQQFFTDSGIASRLLQGAVQVGASYATYGLYRPNNQNNVSVSANKTSTNNKPSIVPTGSGGSPTAVYNNLSTSSTANPNVAGSTGGQGGQGGTTQGELSFSNTPTNIVNTTVSPTVETSSSSVASPSVSSSIEATNNNVPVISPTNTNTASFPATNGSGNANDDTGGGNGNNGNCGGGNCGNGNGNGGGNGTGNEGNGHGNHNDD